MVEKVRTGRPRLIAVPRPISLVHRWLGICVGPMFALWFASGAVLTWVPFPVLSTSQRTAGSALIDFTKVRIAPRAALESVSVHPIESLRLISVAGQPRYLLSVPGRPILSISAQSGRPLGLISPGLARKVAASFSRGEVVGLRGPLGYDQWTVHDQYDPFRPFYIAHIRDGHGTELYVSARSGQVVQRTDRFQRDWNRLGAVVHWINVVSLRRHKTLWRWVMLTLGIACTALAVLGIGLGIVHLINARRARRTGLSPFRGWLRWHHITGILVGAILLSWIVSGCLMLDDGVIFPSDKPTIQELAAFRGMTLRTAAAHFPLAEIRAIPSARQVDLAAVHGMPYLVIWDAANHSHLASATPQGGLSLTDSLPHSLLLAAAHAAWPGLPIRQMLPVGTRDAYQVLSHPLPTSTMRIIFGDEEGTWLEIDAATDQIVSVSDNRSRARRWWVYGLHDLDFPGLDRTGPLRPILIMLASMFGFAFSLTGVVLAVKRLRR